MDGEEGSWSVYSKKSKGRAAVGAAPGKTWGSSSSAVRAPGKSEGLAKQGRGNNDAAGRNGNYKNYPNEYHRPTGRGSSKQQTPSRVWEAPAPAAAPPPLQNGWNWASRGGSFPPQPTAYEVHGNNLPHGYDPVPDARPTPTVCASDDDDDFVDSDEGLTDDYDSDTSQKSHETQKKSKWFKGFFEALSQLTIDEINEPARQWHCPACQNGPGSIDWYKMQPLVAHAKTKGATRVKLHRQLAALLEEELRRKGTSMVAAGEVFGKWKGLRETVADHEIVWPPMVVVMNTHLEKDDNDMWVGMGNPELIDYFSAYAVSKARHSYGPQGHRGMSVLIFDGSPVGYLEAERLHKHFADQGTDRDGWNRSGKVLLTSGGKRQLFGWLASKEDLNIFNRHSQGKSRLKFDMKSYYDEVVNPMREMNEQNQQLNLFRNKAVQQEQRSRALEESFDVVSQKLRETVEENVIVRLRSKSQHEEHNQQMDSLEKFFSEQMDKIHKETEEKVRMYEKLLQDERANANKSDIKSGTSEEMRLGKDKIAKFIASQVKGVEDFEEEQEQLSRELEEKTVELRQKYLADLLELEKQYDASLTKLMEKFAPSTFQAFNNSTSP